MMSRVDQIQLGQSSNSGKNNCTSYFWYYVIRGNKWQVASISFLSEKHKGNISTKQARFKSRLIKYDCTEKFRYFVISRMTLSNTMFPLQCTIILLLKIVRKWRLYTTRDIYGKKYKYINHLLPQWARTDVGIKHKTWNIY